jgi:hypothetical protein
MRWKKNLPIPGKHPIFNMDSDSDRVLARKYMEQELGPPASRTVPPGFREVLPRDYTQHPVGSLPEIPAAGEIMESLDVLIDPSKFKDEIDRATELKLFPYYYRQSWLPDGGSLTWDQDGLSLCWTWGGTGCLMTLRSVLGLSQVNLAPVSMGYLVGWANRGNYLASWIRGAREQGVCPVQGGETSLAEWPNVHINSTSRDSSFWGRYDSHRKNFRLGQVWDINTRSGELRCAQEVLTALTMSAPIYIAHNYWGHALQIETMAWDTSAPNNILWGHLNSHRNNKVLWLEGSKGSPDESYPFISMEPTEIE